ncbi:MAG: AAA family ATPase [Clostridiales bacterium]|jgi:hypothetical protein|nr:AAA family ATPase [Clostridiales bacterium]
MAGERIGLGLGLDDFSAMRIRNCYYIDKSMLIKEVVTKAGFVKLLTKPRRFGKSTNMSMLRSFFEAGKVGEADPKLFSGLAIEKEKRVWDEWYRKYPVIHINLSRMAAAATIEDSMKLLGMSVSVECQRLNYLLNSELVSEYLKTALYNFVQNSSDPILLLGSLETITDALSAHHNAPVIVLIDEYDAPFNHKEQDSFRDQLLSKMSAFFGSVFKGKSNIMLIVVTGCLRIANESIFTGANNPQVYDLDSKLFSRFYGLTENELIRILKEQGLEEKLDDFKSWYNGYYYGGEQIYNISSVLSHISALQSDPDSLPENYWANTSSNDILKSALESSGDCAKVISLIAGETVYIQRISSTITYRGVKREDSLWSVLLSTGYLTKAAGKINAYRIPNAEISSVFEDQFRDYIKGKLGEEGLLRLQAAVHSLDPKAIETVFKESLLALSVFDTAVTHEYVYHVFFAGVLFNLNLFSNRESGYGRYDVQVEFPEEIMVLIFEFKRFEDGDQNLRDAAQRALNQIFALHYTDHPKSLGYKVVCFGVGCSGKDCAVIGGVVA